MKQQYNKLLTIFISLLFLTGCSAVNTGMGELRDIVLLQKDDVFYIAGNKLLRYQFSTNQTNEIFDFVGDNFRFKVSPELNSVFFYDYGSAASDSRLITLTLNESSDEVSLSQDFYSEDELLAYSKIESFNHAKNKVALLKIDPAGAHLVIKDVQSDKEEGLVDYSDSFVEAFWSTNDRSLAYITFVPSGASGLSIFDTENDDYGTGNYNGDYYTFNTFSTSVTDKVLKLKKVLESDLQMDIITWLDTDKILFEVIEKKRIYTSPKLYKSYYSSSFWTYDVDQDDLQEIAEINPTEGWSIKSSSISKDLNKISYIQNIEDEENEKQELWISNIDGSDAEMIYKNYE